AGALRQVRLGQERHRRAGEGDGEALGRVGAEREALWQRQATGQVERHRLALAEAERRERVVSAGGRRWRGEGGREEKGGERNKERGKAAGPGGGVRHAVIPGRGDSWGGA